MYETAIQADHEALSRFYGGKHPNDLPLYSIAAAARHLKVAPSTVRWWLKGRPEEDYPPVVDGSGTAGLSFNDLVELFVIRQLRAVHKVSLPAIRRSVEYAKNQGVHRVLLSPDLGTLGREVFLSNLFESIAISRSGEAAIHDLVAQLMIRIERGEDSLPLRLFPEFDGEKLVNGLYPVSVSPTVSFGRPTVAGTAITTSIVASRIDSGETVEEVSADYGIHYQLITSALVYENLA